MQLHSVPNM